MFNTKHQRGFTLIEILLAIGILAILATAAIIAINPARQFAQARNTQRWSDVNAIMNATYQYAVSHKGAMPPEIPTGGSFLQICYTGAPSCSNLASITSITDNSTYLTAMPVDPGCPQSCDPNSTGYQITTNAAGRIVVQAPNAELNETIELVR